MRLAALPGRPLQRAQRRPTDFPYENSLRWRWGRSVSQRYILAEMLRLLCAKWRRCAEAARFAQSSSTSAIRAQYYPSALSPIQSISTRPLLPKARAPSSPQYSNSTNQASRNISTLHFLRARSISKDRGRLSKKTSCSVARCARFARAARFFYLTK